MRAVSVVSVALALFAACGGGTEPGAGGGGGGGGGGGVCSSTSTDVSVIDNAYSPKCTKVALGATVTWDWAGMNPHTVTFDNTSLGGSQQQTSGSFQKSFPNAGTFNYHCLVHGTSMNGTVQVQ